LNRCRLRTVIEGWLSLKPDAVIGTTEAGPSVVM
jgi:ABC-type hemin transport system substrate-binding protein